MEAACPSMEICWACHGGVRVISSLIPPAQHSPLRPRLKLPSSEGDKTEQHPSADAALLRYNPAGTNQGLKAHISSKGARIQPFFSQCILPMWSVSVLL